jgi:hypothetical protein
MASTLQAKRRKFHARNQLMRLLACPSSAANRFAIVDITGSSAFAAYGSGGRFKGEEVVAAVAIDQNKRADHVNAVIDKLTNWEFATANLESFAQNRYG